MKRLLYLSLAALMAFFAFSCDKNNGNNGNNGQEDIVLPDVVSDICIGDVKIPVKTLTTHHAAYFAICDGLEDMALFAEDIDDIKILGTFGNMEIYPLCVPLGEKSLQDIYDQVDNKAGYALLVITDKKLNAGDYTFIDQIPVGILPESALETIKGALGKYKEMDYFDVKFETRKDVLSPAKPIVGKQWLGVDAAFGTTYLYDIGHIAENKIMWWGPDQEMITGFISIGDGAGNISSMYFREPELPHRMVYTGKNMHEFQSAESGLEVSSVQSNGGNLIFKSKWSFGDCVMIRAYYEENGEDNGSNRLMIPVTPPLKGTHRIYDVMITVGETDYPVACHCENDFPKDFLAMGQNIPFVYLDVLGSPADFQGKDVAGKIVGINRGYVNFADKQANAKDAGAIGVICVNNEDGLVRPVVDAESIPFGIVESNLKDILKDCTSVSFAEAHD